MKASDIGADEEVVKDSLGQQRIIPKSQRAQALKAGYVPASAQEIDEWTNEREFGSRPISAGALGLARGASLGLSDVALGATGLVEPETLREIEARNQTASLAGEAASLLIPGGGLVGGAGKLASKAATKGLTKAVTKGAAEGLAIGTGHQISEQVLDENPDFDAESILGSALLGGGLGGFAELGGRAASKGVAATKKAIQSPAGEAIASKALGMGINASVGGAVGAGFEMGGLGALAGAFGLRNMASEHVGKFIIKSLKNNSDTVERIVDASITGGKVATQRLTNLGAVELLSSPKEGETRQQSMDRISADLDLISSDPIAFDTRVDGAFTSLLQAAPRTAVTTKLKLMDSLMWLRGQVPRSASSRSPFAGKMSTLPRSQIDRFEAQLQTVMDPIGALSRLSDGSLSQERLEALQATYPELINKTKDRLTQRLIQDRPTLSFKARRQIQFFLGTSLEPSMDPSVVKYLQAEPEEEEEPPKRRSSGGGGNLAKGWASRADELAE